MFFAIPFDFGEMSAVSCSVLISDRISISRLVKCQSFVSHLSNNLAWTHTGFIWTHQHLFICSPHHLSAFHCAVYDGSLEKIHIDLRCWVFPGRCVLAAVDGALNYIFMEGLRKANCCLILMSPRPTWIKESWYGIKSNRCASRQFPFVSTRDLT